MLYTVFYEGTSKIPLLFDLVLRLYQVQIKGGLVLHVNHIASTRMIEAGIYGLSRGNNLEEVMRGVHKGDNIM